MSVEELLRQAADALVAGDADAIVPLYEDDAVLDDSSDGEVYRGKAAIRGMFGALFSAPETRFRIASVRGGRDWGAIEWVWSGRSRGSARPFEVRGVSILEIPKARVVRETLYYDPAPAQR